MVRLLPEPSRAAPTLHTLLPQGAVRHAHHSRSSPPAGLRRRQPPRLPAASARWASAPRADARRPLPRRGPRRDPRPAPGTRRVINIFLGGGPPHQDMWDIKTEAPAEIRGEFKPIATNVPGIQIGEMLPAASPRRMDKFAVIRSRRRRAAAATTPIQCMTGWPQQSLRADGRPAEHRRGRCRRCRARSIRRCRRSSAWPRRRSTCRGATPAGRASSAPPTPPFKPDGPGMANMTLNGDQRRPARRPHAAARQLRRPAPRARRQRRARRASTPPPQRALDVLTSSKLRRGARPVARRPRRCASATATASRTSSSTTAPRRCNDQLLMARRLVEAGVRVRDADLRPLGQPRQELRPGPRPRRQARPVPHRPGRGPGRPRHARRRDGGRLGRVRPHAADQQRTPAATTGRR